MLVKYHFVLGAIFSILVYTLFQITPTQAIIIFLASFLIDFDHYLIYVIDKKNLSLKKSYKYFSQHKEKWVKLSKQQKNQYKNYLLIFHGIEFIILLLVLSFLSNIFLYILIGILFHLFLDYIDIIYYKGNISSKLSQIYVLITNKNKKQLV